MPLWALLILSFGASLMVHLDYYFVKFVFVFKIEIMFLDFNTGSHLFSSRRCEPPTNLRILLNSKEAHFKLVNSRGFGVLG